MALAQPMPGDALVVDEDAGTGTLFLVLIRLPGTGLL